MFVTPGSFTPPGRVMLQFSSPRLVASHKVVGSTSKAGKRVIIIAGLLKRVGQNRLYISSIVWSFWGRTDGSCHAVSSAREPIPAVLQEPMEGLQGGPWGALEVVSEETHLAMWPRIDTRLMRPRLDRALLAQVSLPVLAKNWRTRQKSNQPQTVRFDESCREK